MDFKMILFTNMGAWVASILFAAYSFAVLFSVKKNKWIQQKQLDVLIAMAHKAGATEEELQEIMNRKIEQLKNENLLCEYNHWV